MKHQINVPETYIWTPLIGFDKERPDRGVEDYYANIGFQPDGISLFVFCPDIVHYHEGMETEQILPPDNCNYYGNVRNEIREIQQWTNYDLRELVAGLEKRGTATFMGIMGVFVDRDSASPEPYNIGHREWLFNHPELIGVYTNGNYSLNVLKRFKDGSYYEDFFLEKIRKALTDYRFSGLHVSDNFCPPGTGGSAQNGDFSDDMIDQFISHTGIKMPEEIILPIDRHDRIGIQKRGKYIWNEYKKEWLGFLTWRWGSFWKKICDVLHADEKQVMVNNAWCSEPFEAIYRYGIDYKKLYTAGVDYIVAETVATSVHSCCEHDEEPYRLYNYMTMPAFMKAYTPPQKIICLNGVNDATEEWSIITHFPSHLEREIYSLTNYFLQRSTGLQRAMDGFMACLGDGLTEEEWSWLRERYQTGGAEIPEEVLTPTLIWSDQMVEAFLPDYIQTKRWSAHKTIIEFAKKGGQFGVITPMPNLKAVSGPIFIPNIDLLTEDEIKSISDYDRGPILCTSLVERNFTLPGMQPDFYFEDPIAQYKMCFLGYNLDDLDQKEIISSLGEDDGSPDIAGDPHYAEEDLYFRKDLIYRKVSTGFVLACAKVIRAFSCPELTTEIENPFLPMRMKDGRIRLLLGNDNRVQYRLATIKSRQAIKNVVSKSTFPALPAKLVDAKGKIIIPKSDGSHRSIAAYGFVAKIPPGGMTILDVELEA